MTANADDELLLRLLDVAAAAQTWRRERIPKTSTSSQRACAELLAALDALDGVDR